MARHYQAGRCPHCHGVKADIERHLLRCPYRDQDGTAYVLITEPVRVSTDGLEPQDAILVERACAHAMAETLLRPEQWFMGSVDDLAVARLLYALEVGVQLHLNRRGWGAPQGSPLNGYTVPWVVNESVRTGLVVDYRVGPRPALLPAPVHLDAGGRRSTCGVPGEGLGPKRLRLHLDRACVDCTACLSAG